MNDVVNVQIKDPQMEKIFQAYWEISKHDDFSTFAGWLKKTHNVTYLTAAEKCLWVEGTERDLTMFLLKF